MTNVLWHIELSHYNEKARWALDYKGVPYELRAPMPGMHGARALVVTRGKQRTLPVLELEGRTIGDSTAIIAALEQHAPDPPLYPAGAADRARALELEDYFDEQLGRRSGALAGTTCWPTPTPRPRRCSAVRAPAGSA